MKTIKVCKTIESTCKESLEKEVKELVEQGWKLIGDIYYEKRRGRHTGISGMQCQKITKEVFC